MAVELATAYVSLVPSTRGISANLARELSGPLARAGADAGDESARSFGSRFTAGLSSVGATVGRTLATGLTVGLGATALAGGFALKVAGDFEQTRIAFEGILGSAERADTFLRQLRDFARRTPFEFTGLTKSAQLLLAVGFNAEQIIPTMTTLGNVASALGASETQIEGVVRALGQMRGKGKASAQELLQISEQLPGFSAIEAIAKGLGVTTAEAFKLMEQGAVPAEQAISAILTGMQNFPGAAGAMERQSKTLNGVLSNFKDTVSLIAIDFVTPYLPALTAGLRELTEWLSQNAIPALRSIVAAVGGVIDVFSRFVRENPGPVLAALAVIIGGVLVAAVWSLVTAVIALLSPFVLIVGGLAALAAGAVYAYQNFETFRNIVDAVARIVSDLAVGAFEAGRVAIEAITIAATWLWQNVLEPLGSFLIGTLGPTLVSLVQLWLTPLQIAFDAVSSVVKGFLDSVLRPLASFISASVGPALWVLDGVLDAVRITMAGVRLVFDGVLRVVQSLVEWIGRLATAARNALGPIADLADKASGLLGTLGRVGGSLLLPGIPFFQDGGIVPGPIGAPRLIVAHGGEEVIPVGGSSSGIGSSLIGSLIVNNPVPEPVGPSVERELRRMQYLAAR